MGKRKHIGSVEEKQIKNFNRLRRACENLSDSLRPKGYTKRSYRYCGKTGELEITETFIEL